MFMFLDRSRSIKNMTTNIQISCVDEHVDLGQVGDSEVSLDQFSEIKRVRLRNIQL